jgi:hypothetical protein
LGKPPPGAAGEPPDGRAPAGKLSGLTVGKVGTAGVVGTEGLVIWNKTRRFCAPQH